MERKLVWQKRLSRISRWLLAFVFVAAGIPKLMAPHDFAVIISGYGLLPDFLVFPAAVGLPLFELITAAGLIANHRWAIVSTIVLYIIFILILSYGIFLGLDIDCGCFGPEDPEHDAMMGLRTALYRDLLLLVPAVYSLWYVWNSKIQYNKGV